MDALCNSDESLVKLFSIAESPRPADCLLAGYFARVVGSLLMRRGKELLTWLEVRFLFPTPENTFLQAVRASYWRLTPFHPHRFAAGPTAEALGYCWSARSWQSLYRAVPRRLKLHPEGDKVMSISSKASPWKRLVLWDLWLKCASVSLRLSLHGYPHIDERIAVNGTADETPYDLSSRYQLSRYVLQGHTEVLHRLAQHLDTTSMAETLVRVVGADEQTATFLPSASLAWLAQTDIMQLLLTKCAQLPLSLRMQTRNALYRGQMSTLGACFGSRQGMCQRISGKWTLLAAFVLPCLPLLVQVEKG
jgi:hypothetical protein